MTDSPGAAAETASTKLIRPLMSMRTGPSTFVPPSLRVPPELAATTRIARVPRVTHRHGGRDEFHVGHPELRLRKR